MCIFAQNFQNHETEHTTHHSICPLDRRTDITVLGVFIDPQGQIHETLLVAFGETATFAGALFGIDYTYRHRNNQGN